MPSVFISPPTSDLERSTGFCLARGATLGSEPRPAQEFGFAYSRDIGDPDGNSLGFIAMDPAAPELEDDLP